MRAKSLKTLEKCSQPAANRNITPKTLMKKLRQRVFLLLSNDKVYKNAMRERKKKAKNCPIEEPRPSKSSTEPSKKQAQKQMLLRTSKFMCPKMLAKPLIALLLKKRQRLRMPR